MQNFTRIYLVALKVIHLYGRALPSLLAPTLCKQFITIFKNGGKEGSTEKTYQCMVM
jgi:hypothetical protein